MNENVCERVDVPVLDYADVQVEKSKHRVPRTLAA